MTQIQKETGPRVTLGIATYRGDEPVLELCNQLLTNGRARELFHDVVIVDSQGTNRIPAYLSQHNLKPWIRYYGSPHNLGAAGNLQIRLLLAAGLRADWLFALNHDGELNLETVERLTSFARHTDCGAVYPLRQLAPDSYDLTGVRRFPWLPKRVSRHKVEAKTLKVQWLSSNGALYSLRPVWDGARPAIGLWHGFEDYAYGLELDRRGYEQVILSDAILESRYDYRTIPTPGGDVMVSDKPPWLTYYLARNLLLIATRYFPSALLFAGSVWFITRELVLIIVIRGQKAARIRHLLQGVVDGVRGRTGQVSKPQSPAA